MMKRLTLLLWVAGLFIFGIIFTSRPDGRPVSSFGCRQPVPAMGGLRVVRSECTRKWGSSSLPPFRPEQTSHEKADARAGKEIQGRWLAVFRRYSGRAGYLDQYGPEGCKTSRLWLLSMERWGLSMRLKGAPDYPRNAALGCIEDNG